MTDSELQHWNDLIQERRPSLIEAWRAADTLLAEVKRLREGRDLAIARGLDLIDIDEKLKAENARLREQLMDTA